VTNPSDPESPDSPPAPARGGAGAEPSASAADAEGQTAPSYARAGVDLDHDESFIDDVKDIVRSTFRPEVLSSIGGFAGMFKTPERYKDPVLVAATDGVGTKLKLAAQIGRFDTVGIDCVAMVVNDLIVQGAEPVIFLDYLAMGRLDKKLASDALRGLAEGCKRSGCALLGGETATMPGMYAEGELEMVGFSVGVVERDAIIDGSSIRQGDALIGIASSGFHSNGYSLVRQVLDEGIRAGRLELFGEYPELKNSLASSLLAPTRVWCTSPAAASRATCRACCPMVCARASIRSPGRGRASTSGSRIRPSCPKARCCGSSTAGSAWWSWHPATRPTTSSSASRASVSAATRSA
jgi:phosphoribosylaminoimidazole synthetase